jgi:hypothetical protein
MFWKMRGPGLKDVVLERSHSPSEARSILNGARHGARAVHEQSSSRVLEGRSATVSWKARGHFKIADKHHRIMCVEERTGDSRCLASNSAAAAAGARVVCGARCRIKFGLGWSACRSQRGSTTRRAVHSPPALRLASQFWWYSDIMPKSMMTCATAARGLAPGLLHPAHAGRRERRNEGRTAAVVPGGWRR